MLILSKLAGKERLSMVKWLVITMIVLYLAGTISPLPRFLGRSYPSFASLFYPPSFNFHEIYEDGSVLGFLVGSSKQTAAANLDAIGMAAIKLNNQCGMSVRQEPNFVTFMSGAELMKWGEGRQVWCLRFLEKRNLSLELYFVDETIEKVRLIKVNFEGI